VRDDGDRDQQAGHGRGDPAHCGEAAVSEEQAAASGDGPRCLTSPAGCPSPRERELLRHALAMDAVLRTVRLCAEAAENGGGMVPSGMILRAMGEPYRFPLPGDAEALAAYRKVYEDGNRTIAHLAECGRCNPVGYDRDLCTGYDAALRADADEAHREHGGWPPWEQPRRGAHPEGAEA
jgi:hypothetical protein